MLRFARWRTGYVVLLVGLLSARLLGAETDDELLQNAAQRIEKHRKADAVISVVDAAGQPLAGAELSIEQTRHAFLFGSNIFGFGKFRTDADEQAYRQQFSELFNFATLPFYWPSYESRQGEPIHARTEMVARWCKEQGIATKGHPLAWNFMEPRWLPDDSAKIKQLQLERITDCVTRFRGLIDRWDVVNEATHFERDEFKRRAPKMTKMWEETGRMEFVDQCFEKAREAGPAATLLINDYRTDAKYVELIKQMAQPAGKRAYDVVGIQSHMHRDRWTNRKIWDVCQRFAGLDAPLHFTELTVVSGEPGWERERPWDSTAEGEQVQAKEVRRIYTMLFSHPSVTAITWWDFCDRGAWQGAPAGLLDKDVKPKPAYLALKELVRKDWWTKETQETNARGQVAFRGFLGDYKVRVLLESGKVLDAQLTLEGGKNNELKIQVN